MPDVKDDGSKLSKSRLALLVGFGGLLVIIALSGFDALRVLSQFRKEDDQIRRQFLFRNRVLNNIRAEVYLSGTYVRDYLLEPNPERASGFGASLQSVRRQMEAELVSYAGQLEPAESAHYDALRMELTQYWAVLEPVLAWDAQTRQAEGYTFLRDVVFPRRTAMLEIAGRIADINEQQLNAGNERASGLLGKFQTRLVVTLFSALALGLGMAAFSTHKILQLEAHTQARYQEVVEARKQLTHLSARLVEAQETERRSLSRELHDEVGQSLSAVLVELRNMLAGLGVRPEEQLRSQAEVIKGLVEGSIRSIRNMALLLRPSMLDDLGLIPALKWQAREVSKRTSMDVSVATELDSEDLPDDYKTCIYRIVQEALHNCSRHSNATTIRVRVQQKTGTLLLTIQDDGRGFDVSQSKGLGLLGIEERVAQLGGACQVHSGPGIGTIVTVELPFQASAGQPKKDQVKQIRILLADDHNVIRRGLRLLLESHPEFTVVAEAADGRQAIEQAAATRPDVVVLDIAMPHLSGTEAAERIIEMLPSTAIVFLSMHSDEGYVLRALKAGAKGYLLKDSAEGDLIQAIKAVSDGKAFFSPEVSRMLAEDYMREIKARGVQDSFELLTARERETLHLLAEGKSNKDIAGMLGLSLFTVETHRRNLQEKLNLHSLAKLTLYAVRKGVYSQVDKNCVDRNGPRAAVST